MKLYSIISLGCPKNLVDSEKFNAIFLNTGFTRTVNTNEAEIILINTCGFIQEAKEEAILSILEIAELKKNKLKRLWVTGCLVKRYKESLVNEIPEVDAWIDLKDFDNFFKEISKVESGVKDKCFTKRHLLTHKHYAYLRISDGCDNKCSYCTIPAIRGEHKSEKIEDLLDEARYLSSIGVKELIINAQDTTRYGCDLYGKQKLITLLKKIDDLNIFPWIRLLYLHPAHLTEDIIKDLLTIKSLLPYFDIPLQHINSSILSLMNRKIDAYSIIGRLELLRKLFPKCAIRTSFITGFPGEKRKHFNELVTFIKEFRFTRLGVFVFSDEEDTVANTLPDKVTKRTAQKRRDEIMSMQQTISADILKHFIGETIDVIIDKVSDDNNYNYEGRSFMDAPDIDGVVFVIGDVSIGDIVKVKIIDTFEYDMVGIPN